MVYVLSTIVNVAKKTLYLRLSKCISFDVNGSLRHYSTVPYFVLHHGFNILKDEHYAMLQTL